ncbi:MAG: hypothetical protein IKZ15_00800 [Clostridia bacterium]|nr:hypothetical protein [Clostridia bacterium]
MTEKTKSAPKPETVYGAVKEITKKSHPRPIGDDALKQIIEDFEIYREAKAPLENRMSEDELWYKRRHWEIMRRGRAGEHPEPTSAWLFNTLMNKHADAADSYPYANVLPREEQDRESAALLGEIIPVIMERCDFEQTYSDNWWEKLKHGTAAYGVFWNSQKEHGLGDVDIRMIDLLNIYWEPGVSDIQRSRRLFITDLAARTDVEAMYPLARGGLGSDERVLVVDCYYKKLNSSGRQTLHLLKFCEERLLYASENDPAYCERGFYDHGLYPVVLDTLFPEKGTPAGFGYVSVCKDPQMYIDRLSANILETAMMATKVRYFALSNTGINEDELLDWNRPIVHVEGSSLEDSRLKQIRLEPLDKVYVDVLEQKIREMKETSANRDVNAGSSGAGVTAAAAIAALQEAGSKNSRDMISAAYRAYVRICYLCIELVRQFYTEQRSFRIAGKNGWEFRRFSNQQIAETGLRACPVFDVKVSAERRNPFSQMSLNETAKELFALGVFSPEKAREGLVLLELMEFEGKEQARERLQQMLAEQSHGAN